MSVSVTRSQVYACCFGNVARTASIFSSSCIVMEWYTPLLPRKFCVLAEVSNVSRADGRTWRMVGIWKGLLIRLIQGVD
jgi:hypothetical protein